MSLRFHTFRSAEPLLAEYLADAPATWITGPRACGKTTSAARLARTVVRLDVPGEAAAFQADPDAALRGLPEPTLIDEWQVVPQVLGAVKRAVDADPRPGRFLVTGSARAALDVETWPGTGRLLHLPMWGLTQAEIEGRATTATFLDRLAAGEGLEAPADAPDLRDYVERMLRGSLPEPALHLAARARVRWYDAYVEHLVQRDAPLVDRARDPERLRRYFEAVALNTAGMVDHRTLYTAAGINHVTAGAYDDLLVHLGVVDALPAWYSNRLKRLVRTSKRHVVDVAMTTSLLRLDANGVLRDGDLLGRLFESYALTQLRPAAVASPLRPRLYHLRTEQGRHEVDFIAELGGGRVLAIEVKATAAPGPKDATHLAWLREALGDRFVAGALLHTGKRTFSLGDRVWAVPLACV